MMTLLRLWAQTCARFCFFFSILFFANHSLVQAKVRDTTSQPIFKWIDKQGITHYGHRPAGKQAQRINLATLPYLNTSTKPVSIDYSREPGAVKKHNPTAANKSAQRCQQYRNKITEIEQALKRGYREPNGNHYRQQLRDYSGLLLKHCR